VFEVTRAGELVWQWVPPYEPVRALRVPLDACPQLAAFEPPEPEVVEPPPGYRHVDLDAYRFARQGSRTTAVIEGEKRTVLEEETDCRDLLIPAAARVQVGYGIDRDRLRGAGRSHRPPAFAMRLRPAGASADVELLRETVGLEGPPWRRRTIALDRYALQAVRLCVEISGGSASSGGRGEHFAFWEQPLIATAADLARANGGEDDDDVRAAQDLTPEELEVRRKHLKALGYIN